LWADTAELWVEGEFRIHDRARWTRELAPLSEHEFTGGSWTATRLQP
jgi:pyridoxine/pyridoxamine 5'-phosphate oxidase